MPTNRNSSTNSLNKFVVYRSSAGAGKTFTLVKEYLCLLFSSTDALRYKSILAVTFTNKAANEMKERVIDALTAFSADGALSAKNQLLMQEILKNPEITFNEEQIRVKSREILLSILHNYSDIGISTIDKFTHKVIRTFAYDLHLPLNFTIEMDADNLLSLAIDRLIEKAGVEEHTFLTKALVEFTEQKTDEEKSADIKRDLLEFSKKLLNDDAIRFLDELKELTLADFEQVRVKINKYLDSFHDHINAIGNGALLLIKSSGIREAAFSQGAVKGLPKYFHYLADSRQIELTQLIPTSLHRATIENDKWSSAAATPEEKVAMESIKSRLSKHYHEALEFVQGSLGKVIVMDAVSKNVYSIGLLNEIEKHVLELKSENSVLHISEFNKRISAIVTNEPTPFIYERIGEKYKNYLIDEFQDTSVLQWQNMLPLIENSLASGNFNMLVGDGKQAIYRWRNGEVEQFAVLPKIYNKGDNPLIHERELSLIRNYAAKNLGSNYRSKAEIVAFNNSFFRHCSESLVGNMKDIYDSLEQEFNPENTGGLVHLELLEAAKESDLLDQMCPKVLDQIHQLQSENVNLSDIAIITRDNKKGVIMAEYLMNNGIEVVSKESLLISNSAEVQLILSFLRFSIDETDVIAQSEIMSYLVATGIEKRSLNEVLAEMRNDRKFFYSLLKKYGIRLNLHLLDSLGLYEICENIIREFKLNVRVNPFLQFFLDQVLNYSLNVNNAIADFLDWFEEREDKLSISLSEGTNSVNILTVHKSKGLEFPVVIMPFANWKYKRTNSKAWINLDMEEVPELKSAIVNLNETLELTAYSEVFQTEEIKSRLDDLNVLYVALTRPRERLYVYTVADKSANTISHFFLSYLESIGLYDKQQSIYTFGKGGSEWSKTTSGGETHLLSLKHMISADWRGKISMSLPMSHVNPDTESQLYFGNLFHDVLARIDGIVEVDAVIQQMLLEGKLSKEESIVMNSDVKSLLATPTIKDFFAPGLTVMKERSLLLANGETLRPDRVIVDGKKAIVLDYKTGKQNTKYVMQLTAYADVLLSMGYTEVEKYLIYTENKELVKVN